MNKYSILLLLIFTGLFSCKNNTLFEKISSRHSGITFNNRIIENDTINPNDVVNVYNGGGVGIGDFNNDGLPDIYFTGNMVSSKLYLNKGNFQFEDITEEAGVADFERWGRGVAIVDINNDGLPDIYVCNTIYKDSLRRRNVLYVNQGLDASGIPHFKDMAESYGLDAHVQSTMATFFDYDNDGDLDMYLTVNEASNETNPSDFIHRFGRNLRPSKGRLYRNDMDSVLKHPVFHDVSAQAGINFEGYGHTASVADIDGDGWEDIYVSDDFISNNILYINNHDGTFTNRARGYFKHETFNSMGQDIIDVNNDGLPDIVELDMNPEDNYRKKMMLAPSSYLTYQNFELFGYQFQYVRNTLQLNQGRSLKENDTLGIPAFSEIGFLSGIAQTDWSWTPVITDFDNDGFRDLVVTNGFPRDVTDHDFIAYRKQSPVALNMKNLLNQIPQVKLHNYAFRNQGNLRFADETKNWGLTIPTFSNGAVCVDLDNDGAMDMVINNINDEALLYRNTSRDKDTVNTNYLNVRCRGDGQNIDGLGTKILIFYDSGKTQVYENTPYRGYLSTMQSIAHFGLGHTKNVDSLIVKWYNGSKQTLKHIPVNQTITVNMADANEKSDNENSVVANNALFKEITKSSGIHYKNNDFDFIDFNVQVLLPHKFSEYSPSLAVGDIDGNGFDDLAIGGNNNYPGQVLLQQKDGQFIQQNLYPANANESAFLFKDEGLVLFDADGDGKLDLYAASGGFKFSPGSSSYQDRIYLNDGKGNFKADSSALPVNHTSKLCVRLIDVNRDGKMDLFVSGRVDPWSYPKPVSSFIFRNDSYPGHLKFTDITDEVAPELKDVGMISDAIVTDFDGDGQSDLIAVGEWMPICFFKNVGGKFKNVSQTTGIGNQTGWWNSIVAGDFRHTGRMDYIVGNLGLNSLYKATDQYPVFITAKDFEGNGKYFGITSYFLPDKQPEPKSFPISLFKEETPSVIKEFPVPGRDDIIKQMPSIKKRFDNFRKYAIATMDEVLTGDQRANALRLKANTLQTCYLRNDGNGKFTIIPMPVETQTSMINGMVVDDFDNDGNLDVMMSGNDYGIPIEIGRYDAFNGLLLKGDGQGGFKAMSIEQSGIYIPGNGKALVRLTGPDNKYLIAASQNKDKLLLFENKKKQRILRVLPADRYAMIKYRNGKIEKRELNQGSSFLSQSSNIISVGEEALSVQIFNMAGEKRTISLTNNQ